MSETVQLLEPAAEEILAEFRGMRAHGKSPDVRDSEVHAFSTAVSAKRQADALESIAHALAGKDAAGSVRWWLEQIASSVKAAAGR